MEIGHPRNPVNTHFKKVPINNVEFAKNMLLGKAVAVLFLRLKYNQRNLDVQIFTDCFFYISDNLNLHSFFIVKHTLDCSTEI